MLKLNTTHFLWDCLKCEVLNPLGYANIGLWPCVSPVNKT